jgi:hypothetical protein
MAQNLHARGILRTLLSLLQGHTQAPPNTPGNDAPLPGHQKNSCIPNPLVSLYMLFFPDTIIIALIHGVYYTTFSCIQASLSPPFIRIFSLTELQVGLAFPHWGSVWGSGSGLQGG